MISEKKLDGKTICKHGSEPFTCVLCRQNFSDEIPLDHPCKNTCSEWKQGYEKGRAKAEADAQEFVEVLKTIDKQIPHIKCTRINRGFFTEHGPLECPACIIFNATKSILAKWKERGV